jgi:dnd system-associated protein 4
MPETEASRSDRVNIDESVIQFYKALTENASIEESPFSTYKDVFMFAAGFGYRGGSRQKMPAGKKHTIRREVFTESDFVVLKTIAIADTGDVQVLLRSDEILTIAEEYAHAGIQALKARLLDQRGRPLWNLVELLNL